MVDGYLKLLYPDGNFTKEDVTEVLEIALEMRRRVKEQLAQDVLIDAFADTYGMKPWHYKEFRAVIKAKEYLSSQYTDNDVEIDEDLIFDYLDGKISKHSILIYLHMLNGVCSIEEQVALGIEPVADEKKFCTETEAIKLL